MGWAVPADWVGPAVPVAPAGVAPAVVDTAAVAAVAAAINGAAR